MKIAMLAPVWLPVPPVGYGGTELVVSLLTEELVRRGHDVTLFASGDSQTSAKLDAYFPEALGNAGDLKKQPLFPMMHYSHCLRKAGEFDIVHNHAQYTALYLAQFAKTPVLHTIHGSVNPKEVPKETIKTLEYFKDMNFISISNAQRRGVPNINWVETVYNGMSLDTFSVSQQKRDYLLWIGRIAIKKGPLEAIEIAKRTGMKLKMVAAIDPINRVYFENKIRPHIDGKQITFHGEVKHDETASFYQGAIATLVPINWNEPFGLVIVESMACGTPVIAFNRGSVPEIVDDGKTGFIINTKETNDPFTISEKGIDGMVEAVKRIRDIDPKVCREHVERKFSVSAMVDGYEKVYKKLLKKVTS